MNAFAATVNATEYPPHLKHKVIFDTFEGLREGEAMLLVNDHDPVPLRYQFENTHPGAFTWDYLEQGAAHLPGQDRQSVMAHVEIVDEQTLKIRVTLADAVAMVREAAAHPGEYAADIVTIYEKMPAFDYTFFCFYAYDSARLFEKMLGIDPKTYNSFSLDAPDAFFYSLYGGMAGLYEAAKRRAS